MKTALLIVGLSSIIANTSTAQVTTAREELHQVMDDFVRGWRTGDTELLSRVLAMDEGYITWVSGQGSEESVTSMTFRAAVDRKRTHPDYGREGWELVTVDIVDDELAFAKLRIPEGDIINIDYMVCYRVAGVWWIVSNTFVIQDRGK